MTQTRSLKFDNLINICGFEIIVEYLLKQDIFKLENEYVRLDNFINNQIFSPITIRKKLRKTIKSSYGPDFFRKTISTVIENLKSHRLKF